MYDELGVLPPAAVDPESGYRLYDPAQLERAQLRSISCPATCSGAAATLSAACKAPRANPTAFRATSRSRMLIAWQHPQRYRPWMRARL
jgi:hypothetical protein